MVLCEGCCPIGVEINSTEVEVEVELPCFCELCNQLQADSVRTPKRAEVRSAFIAEGRAWKNLFMERLDSMSRNPEVWARTRSEFISIIMTWMEVMVYAGEVKAVPMPDSFHDYKRGHVVNMDKEPDAAWIQKTVDRVKLLFPVEGVDF
jgi:hypothetical protein